MVVRVRFWLVRKFAQVMPGLMIWRLSAMVMCVAAVTGCYVYTAAPAVPALGADLVLELNDRGRSGLGDSIGAGAQTIEGKAAANSDSSYSLHVSRVGYLNRQSNEWTGEKLVVPRIFVSNAQQRTFSKSRTGLAAAVVAAAVVGFISSRGLLGFGSSPTDPGGGKVPGQQ